MVQDDSLIVQAARQTAALSSNGRCHSISCRSEYDRSVNSFSPEGRIFQVEYAIEAIKLGSTAIAVCTSEGVVLAAEKRVTSPLLVGAPSSGCVLHAAGSVTACLLTTTINLHKGFVCPPHLS